MKESPCAIWSVTIAHGLFYHVENPVPYRINTLKDSQRLQKQNDQEYRSDVLDHSNV